MAKRFGARESISIVLVSIVAILAAPWPSRSASPKLSTLPSAPVGVISVAAGGSFQSALNNAQCGDTILLQAGATFTGPFNLPYKVCTGTDADLITIQTSAYASLPAVGTRIAPSNTGIMSKLVSSGVAPIITTSAQAHHYKFIGIELTTPSEGASVTNLVELGSSTQTTLLSVPNNLTFDRCYFHSFSATSTSRRGIALNSASTTISNSYFSGFKEVGADSQAIAGWNGPGPFTITNNYLEAAGENLIFGGADTTITNLIPSNILIENNTFYKQPAWNPASPSYGGIAWTVKNGLELKNANLVTINRNTFDNIFCASQQHTIVLTPRNQNGTNPWAVVKNVTITNTIISNSCAVINISATDDAFTSAQLTDVLVQNLLAYNLAAGNPAIQLLSQSVVGGCRNVRFNHNTIINVGTMVGTDGSAVSTGFSFTNNIMALGPSDIGFHCTGDGTGTTCLAFRFTGYTWDKNVMIGAQQVPYPVTSYFPANSAAVGFSNAGALNFALLITSPYHNLATDGTDIGVNTALLPGGGGPIPTPTPTPAPTATPTPTPTPTPVPSNTCKPNQLISSGCVCTVPPRKRVGPLNKLRCK